MPRINQYTDNTTIENDDKMLTYDTQGAATKLTAFSTVWNWIVSKFHALTSSGAALTPSTDRVLMDKNGTMTRVEPAAVAKYGIETYTGSTIAGSAQTVKSALDALNSKMPSNQNDEVRMKMVMLGARDATFTNGVCVFDLTTVLNSTFRSGKTLSHCMIVQAIDTSGAFIVSTKKTGDWEITIKAVRNNQQEFSETIGVNLMICVY